MSPYVLGRLWSAASHNHHQGLFFSLPPPLTVTVDGEFQNGTRCWKKAVYVLHHTTTTRVSFFSHFHHHCCHNCWHHQRHCHHCCCCWSCNSNCHHCLCRIVVVAVLAIAINVALSPSPLPPLLSHPTPPLPPPLTIAVDGMFQNGIRCLKKAVTLLQKLSQPYKVQIKELNYCVQQYKV